MTNSQLKRYFNHRIAITREHGSWVFLLSPLLIGIFISDGFNRPTLTLILAALSLFLLRHPITLLVKIKSGRRKPKDIPVILFWSTAYAIIGVLALWQLASAGFSYIFWLGIPGIPVFIWYLYLVSKRSERHQIGIEIVGSGVLALSAPAAYWIGKNSFDSIGWWLFILVWLQSAASIVHTYMRLSQRTTIDPLSITQKLILGKRTLLYSSFNVIASLLLVYANIIPTLIFIPFLVQFLESLWGILKPAFKIRPTQIGFRQLAISSIFTVLFIVLWNL